MYTALDMGISVDSFWEMCPRAVLVINKEMARRLGAQPAAAAREPGKLKRLPRP